MTAEGEVVPETRPGHILGLPVLVSAAALCLLTVSLQVASLAEPIQMTQAARHRAVLRGAAPDPWQYRVLSEWLVHGLVRVARTLALPQPVAVAFLAFRSLQNLLVFVLAALYYSRLGLDRKAVLLGLNALAWGMTHAHYDSDLSLNTYGDLIVYLAAALLILGGRSVWVVPLCVLAALNRESSVLIPFMMLAGYRVDHRTAFRKREAALLSGAALAAHVATYLGVRWILGPRPFFCPYGHCPGIDLLLYNVGRPITWINLLATSGILPLLAVLSMPSWPSSLKVFFWVLVPVWLAVHFVAAVAAETRLFLVPLAVVVVPAALASSVKVLPATRRP